LLKKLLNLEGQTDKQDEVKNRLALFCWHLENMFGKLKKESKTFLSYRGFGFG